MRVWTLTLYEWLRDVNLIVEMNAIIDYSIGVWNLCNVCSAYWVYLYYFGMELIFMGVRVNEMQMYIYDYIYIIFYIYELFVNTKCIIKGVYIWISIMWKYRYTLSLRCNWDLLYEGVMETMRDEYKCLRLVINWIQYNWKWIELIILSMFLECL